MKLMKKLINNFNFSAQRIIKCLIKLKRKYNAPEKRHNHNLNFLEDYRDINLVVYIFINLIIQ